MKSTFSFFKHFKIVTLLLFAVFVNNNSFAQNLVSVPFSNGFVGDSDGTNKAINSFYLTSLGWKNIQFTQNSASFKFIDGIQGNDILGTVLITDNLGFVHSIPGFIRWRAPNGGNITTPVFIPTSGATLATNSSNGSASYVITTTKYIGLTYNGDSLTITSGNVTGNSATTGILTSLNSYLDTTVSSKPAGPVTVTLLNTIDTTPTLTGTATLSTGDVLTVIVNNVLYTTSNGLVIIGNSWSLPISSALTVNTYPITATITNTAGYTLSDPSTNELIISEPPVITGPDNGGTSTGLTSAISIIENSTTVYTFTANKAVTWSLDGGEDAAKFSISAAGLLTFNSAPDFENPTDGSTSGSNTYIVIIKATDNLGNVISQTLTVTITDEDPEVVNVPPTNISLSPSDINENVASNSTVGTLSSTDPEINESFTYSLVPGVGDTYNGSFSISGSNLTINNSPDFETKNSYTIRVRTTDHGGLTFEKQFTITINDINEAPTDIALSASAINENEAANSTVGTLSSTDPDVSNSFTYSLVSGIGSTDNASFTISGTSLKINNSPDFEAKNSYTIRVRTTDQGN